MILSFYNLCVIINYFVKILRVWIYDNISSSNKMSHDNICQEYEKKERKYFAPCVILRSSDKIMDALNFKETTDNLFDKLFWTSV